MQPLEKLKPAYLNMDTSLLKLTAAESPYIKNYRIAFGRNKQGKQGGNFGQGKKFQSNWQAVLLDLPTEGTNKPIFFYEQEILNEAYVGVWNSAGHHTIFVIYGLSLTSEIVYQGAALNWTIDPKNFIAPHRAYIRLIYDIYNEEERHIREKILIFTDGQRWQNWINILSSIATKSFNATLFPYFKLYGPHFDADELIDYPVRPPMFAPVITEIARTDADKGLQNLMLNKSTQFAYRYLLTDGRATTLSPFSNPFYVNKTTCSNTKTLTRSVDLNFYAGSAHVEHLQVLVRNCGGDWLLYDTIDKFDSSGANAPALIGDQYWLRTNPWAKYQFDPVANTIHYVYSGDLQATLFPTDDALDFQNDVPIKSVAMAAAGDSLLWCNNLYGYDNLPTETLSKISFSVAAANNDSQCAIKNNKITVYAFMGRKANIGQVAYTNGTETIVRFGGLMQKGDSGVDQFSQLEFNVAENDIFRLTFGNNQNLVCYLAGTPYTAVGVQYLVTPQNTLIKQGTLDAKNTEDLANIINQYNNGGFFIQKFDFYVPAGKYTARLARHDVDLNSDYQSSSTYVMGVIEHENIPRGHGLSGFNHSPVVDQGKEFEIDSTNGDVDLWGKGKDTFYIYVPYEYSSKGQYRFVEGIVVEDNDTHIPFEQLIYDGPFGAPNLGAGGGRTDHNGFYFSYIAGNGAISLEVFFNGYYNCAPNHFLLRTQINQAGAGYFANQNLTIKDAIGPVGPNNRISVKGTIVNCDTGIGLPSVGVTLTGSKTFYTDSNGEFEMIIHEAPEGIRLGDIYFNSGGECIFKSCSCGPIDKLPFSSSGISCIGGVARQYPAISLKLKLLIQNGRLLKEGGKFGFGIGPADLAGRPLFLQEIQYLDIPSFLQTGVFSAPVVSWKVTGKLNLPDYVKYFTIFRTANRNVQTYIQWVGDSIGFLDNKGNITEDGNGAIRAQVIIQSLLDFNIKNNFNTNVNYQFTPGDILRVYDDGNGKLFDPAVNDGYLDYQILGTDYNQTVEGYNQGNVATSSLTTIVDPTGKITTENTTTTPTPNMSTAGVSLVIEYDERLLALKDMTGFWIEIMRPKDIASIEQYCEIVGTIPVINGEPVVTSGTLDTFDTYLQTRFIRIPSALGKSLGHPFCSPSITDFWGSGCTSCGRTLIKDPAAKQTWYEDDVMKTDEIINEGRVNGLGRCREVNRKNFKGQSFGGIVAVHAERNRLVFICTNDWFVSDFELNYVKVTQQGLIQADLNQSLSDPYPKEGSNYGCVYEDTATIIFNDGSSIWVDRFNSGVIALDFHHNSGPVSTGFRSAVNIGSEDVQSYFINKFKAVQAFNEALSPVDYLNNLVEIIAGLDPQTGEYNVTFRPRNGLKTDAQYFVNDEREVFYDMQETLIYNPDFKKWVSFAGYTPEFYGTLFNAKSGIEMITFAAGAPWFHNSNGQKGSNTFYGVQTNQVIDLPMNFDDEKVKIFQNMTISSAEGRYFVDRILTEDRRLFSYIPLAYFKRKEKTWYGRFLRNMGTYPNFKKPVKSLLIDGNRVYGKMALVRLVSDPNHMDEYNELNSVTYRITGSERSEK